MLGPGSYSPESFPWGQVGTAQEQVSFLLPVLPLWVKEAQTWAGIAFMHSHICLPAQQNNAAE